MSGGVLEGGVDRIRVLSFRVLERCWITLGVVRLALVGAAWQVSGMRTTPDPYRGFRFPAEIISHAVWLYHCFILRACLKLRC